MIVSAYVATSIDGFIARENGDIDWLPGPEEGGQSEDYGFAKFFGSVDCLVMGRKSLETVLRLGDWPYEVKRVVVLSTTMKRLPKQARGEIELYSGPLPALMNQLQSEGCSRIYVDGGRTIQSFLTEGLLTDITITTIPILLGRGIPLFGETERDVFLRHVETNSYPSGFVQSTYEVERP